MMNTRLSALLNSAKLLAASTIRPVPQAAIYVGYVGRWNFGDELLHDLYRRVSGHSTLPVLDHFPFQPPLRGRCVVGGGTVIGGPIYLQVMQRLCLTPSRVFCAGVIPGAIDAIWASILSNASVFTRSVESCERLRKLGIDAHALVDPAIFARQIYALPIASDEERSLVVLAPHGGHPFPEAYRSILRELGPDRGRRTVFFASSPIDLRVCRALQSEHGGTVIAGWRDVAQSLRTIAKAKFVVSTRLHPAICAASLGTPFRMLAYDEKHHEFANSVRGVEMLADPARDSGGIVEALEAERPGMSPGVLQWQERVNDFRDLFARPL